jgi:SnoaL-like domain
MDRAGLATWVDGYERAWRTPGRAALDELFTPDATYSTAPFEEPFRGLGAIGEMWEREREGPDEVFDMRSEVVAVDGDTGVVRVEVAYGGARRMLYRDLWIIRLDEAGRCFAFEEWPFWPAGTEGTYASGP